MTSAEFLPCSRNALRETFIALALQRTNGCKKSIKETVWIAGQKKKKGKKMIEEHILYYILAL